MSRCSLPLVPLAALLLTAAAAPASAQFAGSADSVAAIDQRLRVLERKQELADEAAAAKAQSAPSFTAGREGFSWKSADGAYSLKLRGYFHSDGRFFAGDSLREGTSVLLLRRVRTILEATVAKSFDLRIMPDWGGGATSVQDAYVEYRANPKLKIRTGKYKPPFGFERLQSATEIVFVERALPTNLVPNRDIGLQVSGDLASGKANYAIGIFNGVANGASADTDTNDNKEWVGRVFATPFKESMSRVLPGLGFGIAASVGENKGTAASTGLAPVRSAGQQTIFSYRSDGQAAGTVVAQGRRLRWSPQGYWYFERIGLQGEYVEASQEIAIGAERLDHEMRSWQATGSILLTADVYTPRGVSPKKSFDPKAKTWGAIALDGRYSKLNVEGSAFPTFASPTSSVTDAEEWGAGVSWFLNRNVKVVVDYEETKFEGGASAAAGGDREKEKIVFARTQFSF